MKRSFVVLSVIVLGVGLFWWGQRSRSSSTVVSASEEVDDSSVGKVVSETNPEPQKNIEKPLQGSANQQAPQRSAAATIAAERMKTRAMNSKMLSSPVGPKGRPNPEHLLNTNIVAGSKWKIWAGVKAVPARSFQGDKSEVLANMGGYAVVSDDSMSGDDRQFSSSKPMVFYDERLSRPGIVTGEIKLSLQNDADSEAVATEYGLVITSALQNIHLFFVKSKEENYDLGGLLSSLKRDPRVKKVELSIVSRSYEKF